MGQADLALLNSFVALIDTNVWVSAFINPRGLPAQVLAAFLDERFVPVVSEQLLDEIAQVIQRPRIRRRIRVSDEDIADVLVLLRDRAVTVTVTGGLHICRDPKDDFLLETGMLGHAQFAVSRDDDLKRDLDLIDQLRRHGVEVISVSQFLRQLESRAG